MKYIISIIVFSSVMCSPLQRDNQGLVNAEFIEIVEAYINTYSEIPNTCNAKPIYEISFKYENDSLRFLIDANLGVPSSFPPAEPGSIPPANPLEIRGISYVKNRPVIIYDYKNSNGYGLYNLKELNGFRSECFEDIGTCAHEKYPEGFYYRVTQDSIYLIGVRESYNLR